MRQKMWLASAVILLLCGMLLMQCSSPEAGTITATPGNLTIDVLSENSSTVDTLAIVNKLGDSVRVGFNIDQLNSALGIILPVQPAVIKEAYTWDSQSKRHVRFYVYNFNQAIKTKPITRPTGKFMAADFASDTSFYYAISYSSSQGSNPPVLVKIYTGQDTLTLVNEVQGARPAQTFTGMAYDDVSGIMYAVISDTTQNSWLSHINLTTAQLEIIGAIGFQAIANLGVVTDGPNAGLYGIDINTNQLVKIDKNSGAGAAVGSTKLKNPGLGMGMDYNPLNQTLFVNFTQEGDTVASLGRVNLTTGEVTALVAFDTEAFGYMALPILAEKKAQKVCIPPPTLDNPPLPTRASGALTTFDYRYLLATNDTLYIPFDASNGLCDEVCENQHGYSYTLGVHYQDWENGSGSTWTLVDTIHVAIEDECTLE